MPHVEKNEKNTLGIGQQRLEREEFGGKQNIPRFQVVSSEVCSITLLYSPCKIFSELDTVYCVWVDSSWEAQRGCCGDIGYMDFAFNKK